MKWYESLACILVAVLILTPLAGGAVQNLIHSHGQNGGGANNGSQAQQIQGWLTVLVAALTFFALIFQVWIASRQTDIIREQNEILARQTDISERATTVGLQPQIYVKRVVFKVANDGVVVDRIKAEILIGVLGVTAPSFSFWSEKLYYETIPDPLPALDGEAVPISAEPGETIRRVAYLTVTEEIKAAILGKKLRRFFLVGTVWYDDVFGNATWFQYCYSCFIEGGLGRMHGAARYNWRRKRHPQEHT